MSMQNKGRILKSLLLIGIFSLGGWQIYHYFKGDQRQLMAIDVVTGQVKWRVNIPEATDKVYTAPIILSRDRVLVTQFPRAGARGECAWIEFDRHSGRVVWRKSLKELGLDGCPAPYIAPVAQDGKLYTFWRKSINDGERSEQAIVAMDFTTHQVQWKLPIQMRWRDDSREKELILTDGKLIAGISDDNQRDQGIDLKALNPQTGDVIWQTRVDGALSSNFDRSRLISYNKSLILLASRSKNQWLVYSTETGKLIATYTHYAQSVPFQWIWKILPNGDQLYALGGSEVSKKVASVSVAEMKITNGMFALENQSPNLFTDKICPDLRDLYSANGVFLVLCRRLAGERQVVALDAQTYKPLWQVQTAGLSSHILMDVSGDHAFVADGEQVRAVATKDGRVLWSLLTSYAPKPTIDGDTLFVVTEVSRKIR